MCLNKLYLKLKWKRFCSSKLMYFILTLASLCISFTKCLINDLQGKTEVQAIIVLQPTQLLYIFSEDNERRYK